MRPPAATCIPVAGSGATATANITPITQLIVTNLAGKDPATYFTSFAAAEVAALTSSSVDGAHAKVVAVLKNNGVDASTLGNLITGSLVAANGSTAGNGLDQVLDELNAKLTSSGVTLAQFVGTLLQTVVTATPSGTGRARGNRAGQRDGDHIQAAGARYPG